MMSVSPSWSVASLRETSVTVPINSRCGDPWSLTSQPDTFTSPYGTPERTGGDQEARPSARPGRLGASVGRGAQRPTPQRRASEEREHRRGDHQGPEDEQLERSVAAVRI